MNVSDTEVDVNILKANHEEADTIVVLHCIYTEAEHIVVSAHDTDIAVLLLAHFDKIECKTLWLKSGTYKKPKYIPIHKIRTTLALEQSFLDTIPAFHAITGCDTVSFLSG